MNRKVIAILLLGGLLLAGSLLAVQSDGELILYDTVDEALADPKVADCLKSEYPELFWSEEERAQAFYEAEAAELTRETGRKYTAADVAEMYEEYGLLLPKEDGFADCKVLAERKWFGITRAEILDDSRTAIGITEK